MKKITIFLVLGLLLVCLGLPTAAADVMTGEAQVSAYNSSSMGNAVATLPYYYTLSKGDSLEKIAANAGVNVHDLMGLNGLTSYAHNCGMTIIISQGNPDKVEIYKAEDGDTAASIAKSKGVNSGAIVNINRLESADASLTPGQLLIIPRATNNMAELVEFALSFEGYPYVSGGKTPEEGFDCSGFVYYVYRHFGVDMPRVTTVDQCAVGTPVDQEDLQPGDLLGFGLNGSDYVRHTGIYVGDVDGDGIGEFIHAANSIRDVTVDNITMGYYVENYICASRITLP